MFDGNHRSRRNVNLGGASNKRSSAAARLRRPPGSVNSLTTTGSALTGSSSYTTSITTTTAAVTATTKSYTTISAATVNSTKGAILEASRIKRQERKELLLRETSAKTIQRVYRGYSSRCRTAQRIEDELTPRLQLHNNTVSPPANGSCIPAETPSASIIEITNLLNFRLALPVLLPIAPRTQQQQQQTRNDERQGWTRQLLLQYASRLEHFAASQFQQNNTNSQPPLAHRIVLATLKELVRSNKKSTANDGGVSESERKSLLLCILNYCFQTRTTDSLESREVDATNTVRRQLGGSQGFGLLVETLQKLVLVPQNQQTQGSILAIQSLWDVTVRAVPNCRAGRALMGALLMSTPGVFVSSVLPLNERHFPDYYREWFLPMVSVITAAGNGIDSPTIEADLSSREKEESAFFMAAAGKAVKGKEITSLSNALLLVQALSKQTDVNPSPVLRLVEKVVSERPDLLALTGMVVAHRSHADADNLLRHAVMNDNGNSAMRMETNETASSVGANVGEENADVDSDSESDDEVMQDDGKAHMAAISGKKARTSVAPSSGRLTKQDLLTVPKLDRLYHTDMEQWKLIQLNTAKNDSSQQNKEALIQLALLLGDGEQWLTWGDFILAAVVDHPDDDELRLALQAYIHTLASLLGLASTGLRPRASAASAFVTKLAFAEKCQFVSKLWNAIKKLFVPLPATANKEYIRNDALLSFSAVSVFCDVFAHYLIPLKDDQFLLYHTDAMADSGHTHTGSSVMARDVIAHLRDLLYILYWNKPVQVADIRAAFVDLAASNYGTTVLDRQRVEELRLQVARGRLLLSGTKLWNSLYERWCRLLRQSPFCDESTWLFPTMTSATGEGALTNLSNSNRRRRGAAAIHDDDEDQDSDGMDVDSGDEDNDGEIDHPMSAADAENEALAEAFSDPKMARILTCIPQALPFDRRVKLFDTLLRDDKAKSQDENLEMRNAMLAMMMRGQDGDFALTTRERVEIHRDRLYSDSMRQLNQLGPKLKRRVQVAFINQHGTQEAGIDGGGVFKEFIDDLIKDAFSVDDRSTALYRLFSVTPLQTLTVNSAFTEDPSLLEHYEFLGRVLGKAVYESILVEPQFCLPFLNQLLGKTNSLEDLKNFDPEYYRNLIKLLSLSADEINNLGLTFEITLKQGEGTLTRTIELLPGGHSKPVTKQNVIQYVHLVAHQRLNVQGSQQVKTFLRGFRDLIPAAWVRLFSAYELQKLISGDDSIRGIDVASLKAAMQYAAGYHPSQPIMRWFWEIVTEMTPEQQGKFLKFMTSCSRQPLLGFASLEPAPCIQQVRLPDAMFDDGGISAQKEAPLPTSSTCMNLLKLPNYRSKALMKLKLLAAIESGAGFELT